MLAKLNPIIYISKPEINCKNVLDSLNICILNKARKLLVFNCIVAYEHVGKSKSKRYQ